MTRTDRWISGIGGLFFLAISLFTTGADVVSLVMGHVPLYYLHVHAGVEGLWGARFWECYLPALWPFFALLGFLLAREKEWSPSVDSPSDHRAARRIKGNARE